MPNMPELPGMWYDAISNRYYRITADNPRPSPPRAPARRRPRAPAARLAMLRETGPLSATKISGSLLSTAKRRSVEGFQPDSLPSAKSHAGCFPVATDSGEVELLHYPSGRRLESQPLTHQALALAWRPRTSRLAVAVRAGTAFDHVLVFQFPQHRGPLALLVPHVVNGAVNALALSDEGVVLAGSSRRSFICGPRGASALEHPDGSDALAVELLGERDAVVGTRAGAVYRYDLRGRTHTPCGALAARAKDAAVACMKPSRDPTRIYVSTMRNAPGNLCAWDWRMARDGPLLCFGAHVNECKPCKFDVDETGSGGLLMAGGDDGMVRMWDCNNGGQPIADMSFGDEIPLAIKLACWQPEKDTAHVKPGAWIATDSQLFVMQLGADESSM